MCLVFPTCTELGSEPRAVPEILIAYGVFTDPFLVWLKVTVVP